MKTISGLRKYAFSAFKTKLSLAVMVFSGVTLGMLTPLSPSGITMSIKERSILGFVILTIPAVFSSGLTSIWRKEDILDLRRSSFLALIGELIVGLICVFGALFTRLTGFGTTFQSFLLANTILFAFRMIIILAISPSNLAGGILVSSSQPALSMSLYLLYEHFQASKLMPPSITPLMEMIKTVASFIIMFIAVWAFILVVNTPFKDRFGAGILELLSLTLAELFAGGKETLEKFFSEIGQNTDVFIGLLVLREKKTGRTHALITPYVHPGPYMELGSSNISYFLAKSLTGKFEKVVVFHGTATHDLNLVSSSEMRKLSDEVAKVDLSKLSWSHNAFTPVRRRVGQEQVLMIPIGKTVLAILSKAPNNTEDIHIGVGLPIMYLGSYYCRPKIENCLVIDAHNSLEGYAEPTLPGTVEALNYIQAVETALKEICKAKPSRLKYFISHLPPPVEREKGIGDAGISLITLETDNYKTGLLVIDGNNVLPEVRERLVDFLKKKGYDEAEVLTTDTHTVNKFNIGMNPLGSRVSINEIINWVSKLIPSKGDLKEGEAA